jgi:uncharacterized coiled-coil DUF342 family protein
MMTEWGGPALSAAAAVMVALVSSWAGLRQYARKVRGEIKADAVQAYLTEEQLQADFRAEMRKEMQRMRDEHEARALAMRHLEEENSQLRKQVAGLEIEIMQLKASLQQTQRTTGSRVME